jgi:hypothetical protein
MQTFLFGHTTNSVVPAHNAVGKAAYAVLLALWKQVNPVFKTLWRPLVAFFKVLNKYASEITMGIRVALGTAIVAVAFFGTAKLTDSLLSEEPYIDVVVIYMIASTALLLGGSILLGRKLTEDIVRAFIDGYLLALSRYARWISMSVGASIEVFALCIMMWLLGFNRLDLSISNTAIVVVMVMAAEIVGGYIFLRGLPKSDPKLDVTDSP